MVRLDPRRSRDPRCEDCDVVYFTTEDRTITKPQLKVEVGAKEAAGDRPLCYCFGHSIATNLNAV